MAEKLDSQPEETDKGQPAPENAVDRLDGANGAHSQPSSPLNTRTETSASKKKDKGPEGGFDATPIPRAPPGYTVKITFHRANNLPLADINTCASHCHGGACNLC